MRGKTLCTLVIVSALVGVALGMGCAGAGPGAGPGAISGEEQARIEQEILELELAMDRAYESNDLETYWSFYADDLSQFWDTGRVTLEQYKKQWTELVEGGGGVLESRSEDIQVRVSPAGDAAIVTYPLFVRYRNAEGEETASWNFETDVWFKLDGQWKMVHYHFSTAAEGAIVPE